jgi:hypothetical protein
VTASRAEFTILNVGEWTDRVNSIQVSDYSLEETESLSTDAKTYEVVAAVANRGNDEAWFRLYTLSRAPDGRIIAIGQRFSENLLPQERATLAGSIGSIGEGLSADSIEVVPVLLSPRPSPGIDQSC